MKFKYSFLPLILCIACSVDGPTELPDHIKNLENLTVYPMDVEPTKKIQFEQKQTFGDTDDVFIGRFTSTSVDEAGRVYIADGQELDIKVYGPEGQLLTRLGREGQGPGEFLNLSNVQIKEYRIFAYDNNQQRAVVFSTDSLVYSYTVNIADNRQDFEELQEGYISGYYVRSDDAFLFRFTRYTHSGNLSDWDIYENTGLYYLLDKDGRVMSEKLFEMNYSNEVIIPVGGMSFGRPVDFYGKSLIALSKDDYVYSAWTEDFLIKVFNPKGEYERAFYYDYERLPLTMASAYDSGTNELIVESMPSMELPDRLPALDDMFVDDENRIWVSVISDDRKAYTWWILDEFGELQTTFTWPRKSEIKKVMRGNLYTLETEEETGLQMVVKYQIEWR